MGEQFEDQNVRVTFKTFLKHEDPRLEEDPATKAKKKEQEEKPQE